MFARVLPPVRSPIDAPMLAAALGAALRGTVASAREAATETAVAHAFDARRVVLVDSGTSALTLALRLASATAARRMPSAESARVALPAFGCYDLATACLGAGLTPLLYDIEPRSLTPDLASLRAAFDAGARIVVVYEAFGLPLDFEAIAALAAAHDATVIEDAAQADGCRVDGRPAGSFTDIAVLSFGRGKGCTAGGGGALLLRGTMAEEALPTLAGDPRRGAADVLKLLAQGMLGGPALYRVPASIPFLGIGETPFRAPHAPQPMTAVQRAALLPALRLAVQERQRRQHNATALLRGLRETALQLPALRDGTIAGWLRLPVFLPEGTQWTDALAHGARRYGVVRTYPQPLSRLEGFGSVVANVGAGFPGAEEIVRRLVTVPTHGALTAADVDAIIAWARRTFGGR